MALAIMAVMAALTWRGIDGMARAQAFTERHTDDVLALQAGLAQWRSDLDAMMVWPDPPGHPIDGAMTPRSLGWDGRVLRITRQMAGDAAAGLVVVAWTRRNIDGAWARWQSAPVRSLHAWQAAWEGAARWVEAGADTDGKSGAASAVSVALTQDWQIHYFRGNAWTNPLSSPAQEAGKTQGLPDAIRLRLTLASGQAIAGAIELDWIRPEFGGAP